MSNIIVREFNGLNVEFKMINGQVYAKANTMAESSVIADWKRSPKTEELMEELSYGKIPYQLIISNKVGENKGTYIHEDLIIDLANYISVKFRVWCQKQIATLLREGKVELEQPKLSMEEQILNSIKYLEERVETIKIERDEAIRTKAHISDKKTATAMGKVGGLTTVNNRLKVELDKSKEFASIKRVEKATKTKFDWRKIRNYCTGHEVLMRDIPDANYGTVKAYPAEAWQAVFGIDISRL